RQRPPGLVALEVADQVPGHRLRRAGEDVDFFPELLGIVLAQVADPALHQRPEQRGRSSLGHRHQGDFTRAAPRPPRPRGDAVPDGVDVLAQALEFRGHGFECHLWIDARQAILGPRAPNRMTLLLLSTILGRSASVTGVSAPYKDSTRDESLPADPRIPRR